MTPSPLPAWPELEVKCRYKGVDWRATVTDDGAELRYERARAAYWEARCRLAVAALRGINVLASVRTQHSGGRWATHHEDYARNTAEILDAIGELPEGEA